jgi:hypothetical protein
MVAGALGALVAPSSWPQAAMVVATNMAAIASRPIRLGYRIFLPAF